MGNLLIFGCDFFPRKKTSEINFWNDMVSLLRESFPEIVILSVNNREEPRERLEDNVHLYNVRPYYVGSRWRRSQDREYTGKRFHRLPLAPVYKTYSLWRYLPVFDQLIERHDIGVVHYMRVFGLLNELFIRRHPDTLFSITVPTHVDRGFPLHRIYHSIKNRALQPMHRIVATSQATQKRLLGLGLPPEKLEVIPWSVRQEPESAPGRTRQDLRAELGIPEGSQVILWSGPLQDTGAAEFVYSLDVARRVIERSDRHFFVFAFKPDRLARIAGTARPSSSRIRLMETDQPAFSKLKDIADVFLSPVCNRNRTVAPPLTWIEMMALGIPVITTPVAGAAELIDHDVNGLLAAEVDGMVKYLLSLDGSRLESLGGAARRRIQRDYDIRDIAERYVRMWKAARSEGEVHERARL